MLKKAIAGAADMASSPIALTDQDPVNIVHRPKANGAIAHPGNTELHYIIEGSGTVVTGGKIVRKPGAPAGSATIEGGETHKVAKGDVIIVPADQRICTARSTARSRILRFACCAGVARITEVGEW